MGTPLKNLIDLASAAKIYKVSKATIYRWVKDDKIKSMRYNGKKHYDLDALQQAHDSRHRIWHFLKVWETVSYIGIFVLEKALLLERAASWS